MKLARASLFAVFALCRCAGPEEEIALIFPDEASRRATVELAVTAIEPLRLADEGEAEGTVLIECSDVGVFAPIHRFDPEDLRTLRSPGRLLGEARKGHTYPLGGEWTLDLPMIAEDDTENPWGAVLVHIEARADAELSTEDGDRRSTLLSGCYCFRARDASTPASRFLDQRVRQVCPIYGGEAREVRLEPVAPPIFRLEKCAGACFTAAEGEATETGPLACLRGQRCPVGSIGADCFQCKYDCNEPDDFGEVPLLVTLEREGAEPEEKVVLSDRTGVTSVALSDAACGSGAVRATARVVGRTRPQDSLEFPISCVSAVSSFSCSESDLSARPIDLTVLPGSPDFVAVLYETSVEVINPLDRSAMRSLELGGDTAQAVHAYRYAEDRSALAVATSRLMGARHAVRISIYDWMNGELVPRTGSVITASCAQSACNDPDGCQLFADGTTRVVLGDGDVDGDGISDLIVGTDSDVAVLFLLSSSPCTCGQYGVMAASFVFADVAENTAPDLVFSGSGGAYIQHGVARTRPPLCGGSDHIGDLQSVGSVVAARFRCRAEPLSCSNDCSVRDDVVLVPQSLAGSEEKAVRVLYGAPELLDSEAFERLGRSLSLVPRGSPMGPAAATAGDFNGDGADDFALLYRTSQELRVWLGANNGALGEIETAPSLTDCEAACSPLADLGAVDFDGDGKDELAVICDPNGRARLRRYSPR